MIMYRFPLGIWTIRYSFVIIFLQNPVRRFVVKTNPFHLKQYEKTYRFNMVFY